MPRALPENVCEFCAITSARIHNPKDAKGRKDPKDLKDIAGTLFSDLHRKRDFKSRISFRLIGHPKELHDR